MATLYFKNTVNNQWGTLGNWWQNPEFTVPALALPTSTDHVVLRHNVLTLGAPRTVASLATIADASIFLFHIRLNATDYPLTVTGNVSGNSFIVQDRASLIVGGTATFFSVTGSARVSGSVTGNCIFNNDARVDGGVINGNCVFNNTSYVDYGIINGSCVFNNSARVLNNSNIYGNCEFNTSSYIEGAVTVVSGDCVFNNSSSIRAGTVNGTTTFNDYSYNQGTVNGVTTFNDYSYNEGTIVGNTTFFFAGYNSGTVNGDASFDGSSSYSDGVVNGTATFRNNGTNYGVVNGDAFIRGTGTNQGTIDGMTYFGTREAVTNQLNLMHTGISVSFNGGVRFLFANALNNGLI